MARTLSEDLMGTGLGAASAELIADSIGSASTPDWDEIQNKPTSFPTDSADISDATPTGRFVLTAPDEATARAAIGAGTSNLALGTTSTTAKAGDYVPAWNDVTGKPATFPPTIGTTATTAMAGNTAIPAASSTAPAALAAGAAVGVGTTWARADHVHAIPGVSVGSTRGTVLIQAAQANSVAADVATLVTDFNALLAKLRTAGVIAT